jgi:hypothetical protein
MNGCARFVFWLLVHAACSEVARAQTNIPVHVEESSCATVPRDALEAALRVELGERVVEQAEPGTLRVRVSCPDDHALVAVTRPDGTESESATALRRVSSDLRPRVIALTLVEIVRNLERAPAPAVQAEPVEPPPAQPLPAAPPAPRVHIGVSGHGRSFGVLETWLAGGGVGARGSVGPVELGLDLVVLTSEREGRRGSVRALSALVRPSVAYARARGFWSGRIGAGCDAGFASVTGHAEAPHARDGRVKGQWLSPYGFVGGSYRITPWLELGASLEAGWVMVPVVGQIQKTRDVRLDGPWAGLSLGVARPF